MKSFYKTIILFACTGLLLSGCETTELDLRDDPNLLTPEQADPEMVLTSIQLSFKDLVNSINRRTMGYTRMTQQFGAYTQDPVFFDATWRHAYSSLLQDAKVMIPVAEERELYFHSGVGKIFKAYTLLVLVDFFGDVPYSEANQGTDFPNPKLDDSAELYQEIINLLNQALSDLSLDSPTINSDLYYSGNKNNWVKLANSLKLQVYLQTRLVNPAESTNQINALLAENNLINNPNEDFAFRYTTTQTPTDSRHPLYVSTYGTSGTPTGWFMSNNFMFFLKDMEDPRLRYYFYRQRIEDPSPANLPCLNQTPPFDFCYIGDGYFGRDHADDTFTDSQMHQRNTTFGAYPVGGKFDNDSGGVTNQAANRGAEGEGITPMLLSSYVNFMKAEAALTLGTSGNPVTFLEQGMSQSIQKAISFGSLGINDDIAFRPSSGDINDFIAGVVSQFNSADNNGKLDITMKQFMIALWGNGLITYNNYRRTGLPSDLQSPQLPAGPFPRVNLYPDVAVNLNNNISQQPVTNQVFWDTNPANFID